MLLNISNIIYTGIYTHTHARTHTRTHTHTHMHTHAHTQHTDTHTHHTEELTSTNMDSCMYRVGVGIMGWYLIWVYQVKVCILILSKTNIKT